MVPAIFIAPPPPVIPINPALPLLPIIISNSHPAGRSGAPMPSAVEWVFFGLIGMSVLFLLYVTIELFRNW